MEPLWILVNTSCYVTVDFAEGEGYILIKLVTVDCSFLYFEPVSTILPITKAYTNVDRASMSISMLS